MAPNASGHREMDHEQIINLNERVIDLAMHVLRPGGTLLCKIWDGGRKRQLQSILETQFDKVVNVKPDASRSHSAESFFLATGYQNPKHASSEKMIDGTITAAWILETHINQFIDLDISIADPYIHINGDQSGI